MNHTIFYFTGTGNSLKIAQVIAAKQKNAFLVSIAKNRDDMCHFVPEGVVGFVLYYCGFPQIFHECIWSISLAKAE